MTLIVAMQRAVALDLPTRSLALLVALHGREYATVHEMAGRLGVVKSEITRHTDRLIARDLALRTQDPTDRRSVLLRLTETGERTALALISLAAEAPC